MRADVIVFQDAFVEACILYSLIGSHMHFYHPFYGGVSHSELFSKTGLYNISKLHPQNTLILFKTVAK